MTSRPSSKSDYTPIADYGAIGNLRTVALVSTRGSIDWLCFPDLDGPSVFAAILDHRKGGRFRVAPVGVRRSAQSYELGTNILRTTFEAEGGTLTIADFMTLKQAELYRVLRCGTGRVDVELEWSPRFDYARGRTRIRRFERGAVASAGSASMVLSDLPGEPEVSDEDGPVLRLRFPLRAGETYALVTRYDSLNTRCDLLHAHRAYDGTRKAWLEWVGKKGFGGPWKDQLVRSGLALKLLTHAHTGALAAAATTSLPEEIGGVRNWDYRYTWIRDSAFTVQALFSLGHHDEALSFLDWLASVVRKGRHSRGALQVMYGLHGETDLPELALAHLEGYRGSRPVRIGNAAAKQRQLDIYGELIGAAFEVLRRGAQMDPALWGFLTGVVDAAADTWRQPDSGIWEIRGGPKHFVYSKVMVWVALDRALLLAKHFGLKGNVKAWRQARDEVRAAILTEGYDQQLGAFVQSFGSKALDAANLLIPLMGFLPIDDPRVQGTIDRTLERLTVNGLVYRYLTDDGLPGGEGAFGLATFWLIDALALSGRTDKAQELLQSMAARANHVGLFSEEFDPKTGEFLGNFPQAFTHTGFVNAALYVTHALGHKHGTPAPMGSKEHEAEVGH